MNFSNYRNGDRAMPISITNPSSPWRSPPSVGPSVGRSTACDAVLTFSEARYLAWALRCVPPWRFEEHPLSHWREKIARESAERVARVLGV